VFAYNKIGYGPPAVAVDSQKPMVVPGRPTLVSLVVVSGSSLRATWSAPLDPGGDIVTAYRVEWDTDSDFPNFDHHDVLFLAGGAPFHYDIPNLTKGVVYYVRVRAQNSQGFGLPQTTTPAMEYPRQLPSAPTNVRLGITSGRQSDGKLTVSWQPPTCDGGDAVTSYRISWDVASTFDSPSLKPDKDFVDVLATNTSSYTISNLTPGVGYWIRVAAENRVGRRYISTPLSARPRLQRPGSPSSATVNSTTGCGHTSGCLQVQWNHPRVPFHGIPCSGGGSLLPDSVNDCPATMGRGQEADGGSPITSYRVEWSLNADYCTTEGTAVFSGADLDDGEPFVYQINNLTPGRTYHVRVSAVNAQGMSEPTQRTGVKGDGDALSFVVPEP
jgi:hypothetical protein